MEEDLLIEGKEYISSSRAAETFKYSNDYIGQLCRGGKVEARRIGKTWYVEKNSLRAYCADVSQKEETRRQEMSESARSLCTGNGNASGAIVPSVPVASPFSAGALVRSIVAVLMIGGGVVAADAYGLVPEISNAVSSAAARAESSETSLFAEMRLVDGVSRPLASLVSLREKISRRALGPEVDDSHAASELLNGELVSEEDGVVRDLLNGELVRKDSSRTNPNRTLFSIAQIVTSTSTTFSDTLSRGIGRTIVLADTASAAVVDTITDGVSRATESVRQFPKKIGSALRRLIGPWFVSEETKIVVEETPEKETTIIVSSPDRAELDALKEEVRRLRSRGITAEAPVRETIVERVVGTGGPSQTVIFERVPSDVNRSEIDTKFEQLNNKLASEIFRLEDSLSTRVTGNTRSIQLTNRITQLKGATFTDTTFAGSVSGISDAHIPDDITVNGAKILGALSPTLITQTDTTGTSTFASSVAFDTSLLFVDAANDRVGVGTSTPIAGRILDVAGNIGIMEGGYLNFGYTSGTDGYGIRNGSGRVQIKHAAGANWTDIPTLVGESGGWVSTNGVINLATSTNLVGLGTSTPYAKLTVWGQGTTASTTFEVANSASTTLFRIQDNGRVGIATSSPSAGFALAVHGNALLASTTVSGLRATSTIWVEGTATSTFDGGIDASGIIVKGRGITITANDGAILNRSAATSTWSGGLSLTSLGASSGVTITGGSLYQTNAATNTLTGGLVTGGLSTSNGIVLSSGSFQQTSTAASYFSGALGVGTTTPGSFTLAVHGNALFASTTVSGLTATGTIAVQGAGTSTFTGGIRTAYLELTSGGLSLSGSGSASGFGSSTPWGTLSIEQDTVTPGFVVSNTGSTSPAFFVSGVNSNGRIGIGSSNPQSTLQVFGRTSMVNAGETGGAAGASTTALFVSTSALGSRSLVLQTPKTGEGVLGVGQTSNWGGTQIFSAGSLIFSQQGREPQWVGHNDVATSSVFGTSGSQKAVDAGDLDGDGDMDVIGIRMFTTGTVHGYRNIGTGNLPKWVEDSTLVEGIPTQTIKTTVALADIDADGDLDLFLGEPTAVSNSTVVQYNNVGTPSHPIWQLYGDILPADDTLSFHPGFGDLDNDGDYDMLVSQGIGFIDGGHALTAFENTGSAASSTWARRSAWDIAESTGAAELRNDAQPRFVDIDGDGDLDFYATHDDSTANGGVRAFENTGTKESPVWTRHLSWVPLSTGASQENSMITFDYDFDGDYDVLFLGNSGSGNFGGHGFYENTASRSSYALAGGRLGVASSTPSARLSVEAATTSEVALQVSTKGSTTPSLIITGGAGNGRLGVGTSSPLAKLSVHADAASVGSSERIFVAGYTPAGGSAATAFMIDASGRVGIATSSPSAGFTLAVHGNALLASTTVSGLRATSTIWVEGTATSTFDGGIDASGIIVKGRGITITANDGAILNRSTATSTFSGGLSLTSLSASNGIRITGGSINQTGGASSTLSNGIDITAGCFSVNGTCVGGSAGTVTGSGSAGQVTFWSSASVVSADSNFFWDNTAKRLGLGSTTPAFLLSVHGNALLASTTVSGLTATGTLTVQGSATSTFAGGLQIGNGLLVGTTTSLAKLSVQGEALFLNWTATSTTATSTFAGGLATPLGDFVYEKGSGKTYIDQAQLGALEFDESAGAVQWANLPVASTTASSTVESYTAYMADLPAITVFGRANTHTVNSVNDMGVAIGTTTSAARLTVWGGGTGTKYALQVVDNASTTRMVVQDNGLTGFGTTTPAGTVAIDNTNNNTRPALIIKATGSGDGANAIAIDAGDTCQESGAAAADCILVDLAELFPTLDATLRAGEIVSFSAISNEHVERAAESSKDRLAGVVSTSPAIVFEGNRIRALGGSYQPQAGKIPLALAGRVPVKVTQDGGPIYPGDRIAISSTPGYGARATTTGMVIGTALTSFATTTPNATSSVIVFIHLEKYIPAANLAALENLAQGTLTARAGIYTGLATGTVPFIGANGLITSSELFVWDATKGRLGIGTTTPSAALAIAGDVLADVFRSVSTTTPSTFRYASTTAITAGDIYTALSANTLAFINETGKLSSDAALVYDRAQSRLGIGTTSPYATLSVEGAVAARGLTVTGRATTTSLVTADLVVGNASTTNLTVSGSLFTTAATGRLYLAGQKGELTDDIRLSFSTTTGSFSAPHLLANSFTLASSTATSSIAGALGIGTTTPEYKLHVLGDVAATGFINISTGKSKKDIEYLTESEEADFLKKLDGVNIARYHYRSEKSSEPSRLGLIAEEAPEEVLSAGGKGVDIYKLTSFTLAAVKAEKGEIEDMKIDIKNIEAKVNAMVGQAGGRLTLDDVRAGLANLGTTIESGMVRVRDLAAEKVTARKLCVDDVCVTRDEFKVLVESSGGNALAPAATGQESSPAPASIPAPEPAAEPSVSAAETSTTTPTSITPATESATTTQSVAETPTPPPEPVVEPVATTTPAVE